MSNVTSIENAAKALKTDGPTASERRLATRFLAAYRQMLIALFVSALVVIVVMLALLWSFHLSFSSGTNPTDPSTLLTVVICGTLGALFSTLTRLYEVENLPRALVDDNLLALRSGSLVVYSLVPLLIGAIAAGVVYLAFASGFFSGTLFPTFACKTTDKLCATFGNFVENYGPTDAMDYGKVLIWGFIAGFAERFVPNTLKSFADSAQAANGEAAPAPSGTSPGPGVT